MLHTQYVFVYEDTCILVINFAPPKVKSWLRHCHCTRVQKTEDKVEYKIQLYFVFDNILYYIVPRLGPSLVVCTTTFGCCAW